MKCATKILAILCVVLIGSARAEQPVAPGLDFDLFGDQAQKPQVDPVKQQRLERAVATRRRVLTAHQVFGFITLGVLASTLVIGQLHYLDKFGDGAAYTGRYQTPHLGLGIASGVSFATTGILALSAPNPYPKAIRLDTALVHKISMAVATLGMVTQLVLGPISATRDGKLDQRDFSLAHLSVGYVTFAAMATGTIAFLF